MMLDEQEIAARRMPGLKKALEASGVMQLEQAGGAQLSALFREHGQPGFLVPREAGGSGGSIVEIVQILRFIGACCPSLAVMMTMHHHSVAGFARGNTIPIGGGSSLLQRVGNEQALVASAFAEGRPGADILESTVGCTRLATGGGFRLSGAKKPCCMTHNADIAVVGVAAQLEDGGKSRGIAIVDMALRGISRSKFWPAEILASTDSHALTFDVTVGEDCVLAPREAARAGQERLAVTYAEIALSCLFQVMISAAYLGIASRLCELVLRRRGGTPSQRVEILSYVETAAMAVYQLAQKLERGDFSGYLLGQCVLVSHNTAAQIERVVMTCTKALGGNGYLGSPEARYLVLASRCLEFHPPSSTVAEQIVDGAYTDLV